MKIDRIHLIVKIMLVSLTAVFCVAITPTSASAHLVICTNDAQDPYYVPTYDPKYKTVRGATIIDCAPSPPDSQRTLVHLQRYASGTGWIFQGNAVVSYRNDETHRVVDTTSCVRGQTAMWRVRAEHTGTHGNAVTKYSTGDQRLLTCTNG